MGLSRWLPPLPPNGGPPMKPRRIHTPIALALAVALAPFAVPAQPPHEPPVDPATPVDTAPPTFPDPMDPADPTTPVDPRDVDDPVDPAHPWTPPETGQDPTADVPPAPVPTTDTTTDQQREVTGDTVRRGADGRQVNISSNAPDSVMGDYRVDFDALDADGDGYISREEAQVNDVLTAEFHVADSDGDGRLTREELSGWKH